MLAGIGLTPLILASAADFRSSYVEHRGILLVPRKRPDFAELCGRYQEASSRPHWLYWLIRQKAPGARIEIFNPGLLESASLRYISQVVSIDKVRYDYNLSETAGERLASRRCAIVASEKRRSTDWCLVIPKAFEGTGMVLRVYSCGKRFFILPAGLGSEMTADVAGHPVAGEAPQ